MTRKAQQGCREPPETPSSACATPRGELIRGDNGEKGRAGRIPAEMLLWGGKEDQDAADKREAPSTGHLSVTSRQDGRMSKRTGDGWHLKAVSRGPTMSWSRMKIRWITQPSRCTWLLLFPSLHVIKLFIIYLIMWFLFGSQTEREQLKCSRRTVMCTDVWWKMTGLLNSGE